MYDVNKTVTLIKKTAKLNGISTVEMLEHLELNKNTLSTMSNRGSWIKSDSLARIADYLDVSVDYLLGRTEKSSSSELTENEREILYCFSKLTIEQQLKLIGRAEALAEQNETEAVKKDRVS
ncbi:MAG: helix-turn-helix domain-containing protein [Ruminococcus sp.]|nr:helix-turn-helix domain-containing protein [Ruminococcus sp.]